MIWLVGARGMLGQEVAGRLDALGFAHVDSDLDCDITDLEAVREFAAKRFAVAPAGAARTAAPELAASGLDPARSIAASGAAAGGLEWIVNCSAYTAVDKAEDEEAKADLVNAAGVENLGRVARERGARIIHVSTDYVFDGEASSPYREDAPTAPRGAYGRTKAHGERLLAAATREHFIVRTAWLYGARGKNFVSTMLRLMNERDEVSVVDDQHGSPTYAPDLAHALIAIVGEDSRAYGIYHFTNEGETTWFEFARAIYELGRSCGRIRHDCSVVPIPSERYPTKAVRPKYSVLSKERLTATFGLTIPHWHDGLRRFFDELAREPPAAPK